LNSGGQTSEASDTAYQILAYLHANPEAQDTLEGIVEWWLLERRIKNQTAKVNEALESLVSGGLVTARTGKDGRTHYAIERGRREEIETLLKNWTK
jgi:hypothetical protein